MPGSRGRRGTTPVATITPSKPAGPRVHAGLSATRHAAAPRAGAEVAQRLRELLLAGESPGELNWPPISLAASNSVTSWPRSAAVAAQARPAGPAPTTATLLRAARRRSTSSVSWQAQRVDQAGRDLAREGVVEARLVAADAGVDLVGAALGRLATNSGSASNGRAIDTMSASPRASTSSADRRVLMRLVVTSGIVTAPFSRRVTQRRTPRAAPSSRSSGCAPRASRCRC